MRWQTETTIPEYPFQVGHKSSLLLLGSCFTENIGKKLDYFKFKNIQNPFGIVYNPLSLLEHVRIITSEKTYTNTDLAFANEWHFSYDHHSRFSAASAEETLNNINTDLAAARDELPNVAVAFISLGTAFYWWLIGEQRVVNNCHKQPAKLFEQRRASVDELRSALHEVVMLLQTAAPTIEVVFTISPIRHLKHGSAGNQLSKASLIVAAQELAESLSHVHYFPSYELLLDDLRDYRWYEADLIHPNKMAVDYIWKAFGNAFFNSSTQQANKLIEQVSSLLQHRPYNASTENMNKILNKVLSISENCPADLSKEIAFWKNENGL